MRTEAAASGRQRRESTRRAERSLWDEPVELVHWGDISYARYYRDTKRAPRGTIVFLDERREHPTRTIRGFPHVPRTYQLARGIHRLFGKREFYAEEKIDGYNIRIAYQDGWILAFTRGGFVCPLTTEWAQLWWERDGLGRFFAENPEHVLCGEVTGDNPYNNQRDPRDRPGLNLQIFDIRDDRGKVYPVGKRYELVDRYGLPTVPRLGTFTAGQIDTLYERVRELNRNHREGVVLKHRNGRQHLKFVTPENELSDIEDNVPVAFDVGHPYFTNRIFRALLFVRELGLDEEEYSCRLGCAFMEGYKEVERDPEATLDYTVYCRLWDTWEQLAERIGSAVKLERLETEETELEGRGMYRIRFRRHFKKSTRRFTDMVSGRSHVD